MRAVIVAAMLIALLCSLTVPRETSAHTGRYYVTANPSLNLRAGPGGGYDILDQMPTNRIVKARGHRSGWMYLTDLTTGTTGWAALAYLKEYTPPPPPAPSLQLCWDTAFNWTACAEPWIAQAIYEASRYYGVPFWAMMGIASCESAFRPWIVNQSSGVIGLYQFQPSTFYWMSPGANIWSVYDQAYTAAKMLARGMSSHFDCAWRIGYS